MSVTTLPQTDKSTATKIQSTTGRWISRALFIFVLVCAVVAWIGQVPEELAYYQGRAAADGISPAALYIWGLIGIRNLVKIVFLITGLLLYWRKFDDRIVVLTSIFLIAFASVGITFSNTVADQTLYLGTGIRQAMTYITAIFAWGLLSVFIYLFPDGRFVPRWGGIFLIPNMFFVAAYIFPTDSAYYPLNWPPGFLTLGALIVFGGPVVAQVVRYRHFSSQIQRQQTKFVVYALGFAAVPYLLSFALLDLYPEFFALENLPYDILYLLVDVSFIGIPVAIGFALMRSRLWDIDVVINRSLVYGSVAGLALLIFFSVIVGLQVIIGQTQPLVAFVIAGIVAAVVFRPMTKRVQTLIDRHIYHLRFDLNELRALHHRPSITNPGALTGQTIGGYEVMGVIGKGGMGEVYQGFGNGQTVAIKTMLPKIAEDPDMRKRFEREAQAGIELNHPHIAKVFTHGVVDGTPYLVMDYIEGQELRQRIRTDGMMDEETSAQLMKHICDALDTAHSQGFIHRDLKPSNIMIRPNGQAVLMDFGVTKVTDASSSLTGTGAIGTIDYMAPEQITAAKDVDHRADIYALGVMLYEMLTGEKPFKGGAAQILFAHLQQPIPDPLDINPDIPNNMAKAIEKAMAKDPADRFQSAGEFAASLAI